MHIVLKGIGLLLILAIAAYGYLVFQNNRTIAPVSADKLQSTLENSILWLEANREKVLSENNSILWRMIQRVGEISKDQRIVDLFAEYEKRHLKNKPDNIWKLLFYPKSWVPIRFEDIASYPYYNQHFIYALLCDKDLGEVASIAEQNNPAFCDGHPLRPACVTHQLMGIQMMQNSQCGDAENLAETVGILQDQITNQLYYDPRVVDVTMQRVLMLVDTGAKDRVKSAWVQNLIDAQQEDGGWSPFEPLFAVGGGRSFGYDTLFRIKKPVSTFHMTAQGVLLFSLLANPQTP
ncbi:MAG: hypothetical protein V3W04_15250 [Gammaproteobacteria bacterium]